MQSEFKKRGEWTQVILTGRFENAEVISLLEKQLNLRAEKGELYFLLDCSQVAFVETNFITVLLRLKGKLEGQNGELRLVQSESLRESLETTGIPDIIKTYDSLDAFQKDVSPN